MATFVSSVSETIEHTRKVLDSLHFVETNEFKLLATVKGKAGWHYRECTFDLGKNNPTVTQLYLCAPELDMAEFDRQYKRARKAYGYERFEMWLSVLPDECYITIRVA